MSSDSPLVDVACPECGEVYHLHSDAIGKRLQCRNRLCNHLFLAKPPEVVTGEPIEEPPAAESGPPIVRAHSQPDAPPSPAPPADASPPAPAAPPEPPPVQLPPGPAAAAVPASAAARPSDAHVSGSKPASSGARRPPRPATASSAAKAAGKPASPSPSPPAEKSYLRSRKRSPWLRIGEIAALLAIVLFALYVGAVKWQEAGAAQESRWKEIQEDYQEHKWTRVSRALKDYQEQFPDAPQAKSVPFFLDMCKAGEEVFSETGDARKGLGALERVFRTHRDSPAYADYAADLYQASGRLVERFVERAERACRQPDLTQARQAETDLHDAQTAHELLATVGESMRDAWVPERTQKLAASIDAAGKEVRRQLARLEVIDLLGQIKRPAADLDLDSINQRIERLLAAEPNLARDPQIMLEQAEARKAEAGNIRFTPLSPGDAVGNAAMEEDASANLQTTAVVWGRPAADERATGSATVASLARGILYVFDGQGGVRWFRRLGIDSYRPPLRLEATSAAPEMLLAASSENNSLLALEAETGKALWSFRPESDISAPLTVIEIHERPQSAPKRRGLLPTANGEIHVLELTLGKRLGRFQLNRAVTAGGVYDPRTRLAYFPADSERVFALDPAAIDNPRLPACPSLLYTGHPSGAFRSAPIVVGQYLVLSESSVLTQTHLRVFEISDHGFADPLAKPLGEATVRGWSWFPPLSTPDRIMLATDQGELGLFGLNLDNRREAIYPLLDAPADPAALRFSTSGDAPALAAYADDYLLWVMAGGELRKLSVDWFGQTIRTLWPRDSQARARYGAPVHEAQAATNAGLLTLFLTSMSPDGRQFQTAAVDGQHGELIWRRQLGIHPLGAPIVDGDAVLLIDASGQPLVIQPPDESSPVAASRLLQPPNFVPAPAGSQEAEPIRIMALDGTPWAAVELPDDNAIAVRPLSPAGDWRRLPLVERLQGRPAILEDVLVAPCADGELYRIHLDGRPGAANEQTFHWSQDSAPGQDAAQAYPLSADSILLCDSRRRVRRLQFRSRDQIGQWAAVGEAFESAHPLVGECLATKERIYAADASGTIHELDINSPGRLWRSWSVGGRLSGELTLHGDRLLAVVDGRRLACIDLGAAAEVDQPAWICKDFQGRLSAAPMAAGDLLLATDSSRRISGIRPADGKRLWRIEIKAHAGPAASAAPLGKKLLLVPLADGTLFVAPRPSRTEDLAELSP